MAARRVRLPRDPVRSPARTLILAIVALALLAGAVLVGVLLSRFDSSAGPIAIVDGEMQIPAGTYSGIALSRLLSGATWDGTVEHWVLVDDGRPTASFSLTKRLVSFRLSTVHRPVALPSLDTTPFSSWVHDTAVWWWIVLEKVASLDWLIGRAQAVDRFMVLPDAQCNQNLVSTDADCWSTTSGGDGNGLPVANDNLVLDANSGTGAVMDANLTGLGTLNTTGFTGTYSLATFQLGLTTITHAGGTIIIGASAASGLVASGNWTISGTANVQCGTSACNASITGNVNVSSTTAYIDFGSGAWTVSGSWTNVTTNLSWDEGTGTITFDSASNQSMNFTDGNIGTDPEFYNVTFTSTSASPVTFDNEPFEGIGWAGILTVQDTVSTTTLNVESFRGGTPWLITGASHGVLRIGNGGVACACRNNIGDTIVQHVDMTGGTSGVLNLGTGTGWTIRNGNWNTTGAGSTLNEGTATITFNYPLVAGGTVNLLSTDNTLNAVTVNATTGSATTLSSAIVITAALTVSTGSLAKGTQTLTAGSLTMSGGDLTSTSGNVTVSGAVNISSVSSSIDFGSETWTVTGTWTNSSTEAAWDAGTGTMTFTSATGGTMTFAGSNLAESEFNHLTFNSTAATSQTFTMSTRSLRIGGTFTVTDTSSTTALTTSDLNVQANSIQVEANGTVTIGTGDFLSAATFNVDGSLTMDGRTVENIFFSVTSGTMDVTLWTAWQVGADVDVRWTFNPSVAAATVTITLEDVTAGTEYGLSRDGGSISTVTPSGTTVTFAVAEGWSSHTMAIDETGIQTVAGPNAIPFTCTSQYVLPFKVRLRCVPDVEPNLEEIELRWYLDSVYVANAMVLVVDVQNVQPLVATVWTEVALNVFSRDTHELRAVVQTVALDFRANLLPYGFLFVLFALALALVARPRVLRHRTVVKTNAGPRVISSRQMHGVLHRRGIPHTHQARRADGTVRRRKHFGGAP